MEFAPYTDTTLYPTFDINKVPGLSAVCLGFIVSDSQSNPSWGGYYPCSGNYYADIIRRAQLDGKKIIVSFGEAAGQEFTNTHPHPHNFIDPSRDVIEKYDLSSIDFDIEGSSVTNEKANKTRQGAILELQRMYPNLEISLTVAVMPTGVDKNVLKLIEMTPCDIVNLMTMNFGSEHNKMSVATINAAKAVRKQTGKNIGLTPMIGVNDTGEIFNQDSARRVKAFADETEWVKRLSFWSLNRDTGKDGKLDVSSKIKQEPWEFCKIFNK